VLTTPAARDVFFNTQGSRIACMGGLENFRLKPHALTVGPTTGGRMAIESTSHTGAFSTGQTDPKCRPDTRRPRLHASRQCAAKTPRTGIGISIAALSAAKVS
jgi:hypothetical protein